MNYITYTETNSNLYELTSEQDTWVKTVYDSAAYLMEAGEEIFHSAMSYSFNRNESEQLWELCQAGETVFGVVQSNTITYYLHAVNNRILWLDYINHDTVIKTAFRSHVDALHNCALSPIN